MTPHISPLLIRRNAFLILDLGFHILDGVTGLHLKGDGLPSQGLHEDLHVEASTVRIGLRDFSVRKNFTIHSHHLTFEML